MIDALFEKHVEGKEVLVLPAYAENAFIMHELGARRVVAVDSDPKTVQWQTLLAAHYNSQEGRLRDYYRKGLGLEEGAHEVPKYRTPEGQVVPGVHLAQELVDQIQKGVEPQPAAGVEFYNASLGSAEQTESISEIVTEPFDCIYVPFLIGVTGGITDETNVRDAFDELWGLAKPGALLILAPSPASDPEFFKIYGGGKGIVENMGDYLDAEKFQVEADMNAYGAGIMFVRVKKPE
jgi:hypothetical protein